MLFFKYKKMSPLLHTKYAIKVSLFNHDTDDICHRTDDIAHTFVPGYSVQKQNSGANYSLLSRLL